MDLTLNQVVEWMKEQGYITIIKGKHKLTGKLDREYIPVSTLTTVKRELAVSSSQAVLTPREIYMQYIKAADVPSRCPTAKYWLNRYSNEASTEFHRILTKENINLQILVASTKLYYIQTKEYAKTISNYIVEGVWRSGYEDMMNSANRGTLQEDIQKQLSDNNQSNIEVI